METFKRLQYICNIIQRSYTELTIPTNSTLFMNYTEPADLRNISLPNISYDSPFKSRYVKAKEMGLGAVEDQKRYDTVIVSIPKSKEESFAQIATGYERIRSGGLLVVEGNKRNGVDSLLKTLSTIVSIDQIVSKAHGKIAIVKIPMKKSGLFSKWLKFATPSKNEDGFYSMPGLFSHKRIDSASKFLTSIFDNQLNGDVIDFGVGWGFLSSELLERCIRVESVTMIDHDQRAIECAKANIVNPRAIFKWIDIRDTNQLGMKFDTVICNPPFHSANEKNIELGKTFIKAAHESLKNVGTLLLVANIQLPYENLINALFHDSKIYAKNKNFKIILAKKPKRTKGCYNSIPAKKINYGQQS